MNNKNTTSLEKVTQDMLDYLPSYYQDNRIVNNVMKLEASEVKALNDAVQDVLHQFFVDKATWGLDNWERICGITPDYTKTHEERRAVVRSKLRGIGTVNIELMKEVAESYNYGEVDVEELPAQYQINVRFVGKLGIPSNLDDIKQSLQEIIPAHLNISFEFTFIIWNDMDANQFTWDELDGENIIWSEFEAYEEAL
ncbi:YmfQ family protein [Longirhabdus pacifica]|uniref:YmfQ family protein n=1 Tax=Longirhabdus pacifica TaxID=2305227 RepID=UPI001008FCDD|nr:YmfQ family protein [Longirhabdus pacifica]